MNFPFRRVPECSDYPVQVAMLEIDPARFRPALSVQGAWNGCRGFVRGLRENGTLVEDYIREELDAGGRLRDSDARIFGAAEIRRQVWSIGDHRAEFERAHPGRRIAAWTGNGNLLCNPHCVGFAGGVVYALGSEPLAARAYTCLAARRDSVAIETLRAPDFTEAIECAAFGQQIVKEGRPIGREELIRKAVAGEFPDLRHLFLFARLNLGPQRWIDAGLSAFYDDAGRMDLHAVERALRGEPVEADVAQFDEAAVRAALAGKGYRDYELRGGVLRFVPLPGIYPHSMVGVRADGRLIASAIRGLSNRAGVTIEGAGAVMHALGARDAVMLDNGSDVMLGRGGSVVLGSSDGARDRLRSMLLFHTRENSLPRLVQFPPQDAA